ncbi:MAG: thiamine-phosphate kinase [Verrucomicrobia bacterium]|jgi:thiamine-monophosphate kinase|nr:thiamine-phosphate kinase [Verrucomicrobiota bacterium]
MSREIKLIQSIIEKLPIREDTVVGAGDDCAVIDTPGDMQLLFKTDAIVEGIHFTGDHPPEKVGYKALARALSDVAAMGGSPNSAVITIGLPRDYDEAWVMGFYQGLNQLAQTFGVAVVGGETVCSPDRIFCSVALTGNVSRGKAVRRSTARVRDAVFVTGELGGSIDGKHLDFVPRIKEAAWLVKHFDVHAMIDLSDGLAGDIQHICRSSGVGAELWGAYLPVSRAAKLRARKGDTAKPAVAAAMTDGEDFELLFCVDPAEAVSLKDKWRQVFPDTPISCIGKIIEQPEVLFKDQNGIRPLRWHGYDHFQ